MKSLAVEGISVRFGAVRALDRVRIAMEPGQVTMLAGPNGSGKSTLLGVLLGLVRPDSGAMQIDGEARRPDRRFRQHLGYLPEAVAFAPNLNGRQILRFFARARGVDVASIDAVLERVRLTESADRAVRGYSRGMLQRLGIAVATLADPELLVLDEPTGGLDQAGLAVLWEILTEWQAQGRFVLMASHDLVLMERRVNQVVMLASGRVCASGSPGELRQATDLPVRVHFEICATGEPVDSFVEEIRRFGPSSLDRNGKRITAETSTDRLLELLEIPRRESRVVDGVRVEEPGFDVVYDSLLKESS